MLCLTLFAPAFAGAAEAVRSEISIDFRELHEQPFRGWGTSLAWWAHGVGDWPEQTLDEIVRLITDDKDGLGLNVFRYNIGGGDHPEHHHMRRWGDVPGFKSSADAAYDWNADAAQRRVLLKLVKAANDRAIIEAFSNSPPWWMTVSGCTAGAADGKANLKPEFETAFADYLADVVQFYRDKHGLTFDTLEPFNEPDVSWWKVGSRQEGCHFRREQQARIVRLVRAALDHRGLSKTIISATDANSIDDCLKSLLSFDDPTIAALGQVNTHSYSGRKRVELREAAAKRGKPLWQSETGPLSVGGTEYEQFLKTAQRLVRDINELRPQVWCTWQVVAGGPWGCLQENARERTFRLSKGFYMLAGLTRNIRPGDRFVKLESDQVVAAMSASGEKATVAMVNPDKSPREFRVHLAGTKSLPSTAAARSSRDENLATIAPIPIENGVLQLTAAAESVTILTIRTD